MERSERKLDKSKQREGGNPKEGSLESSDSCPTRSKALHMSSATTQDSPKSLRAEDHRSVINDRLFQCSCHIKRKDIWFIYNECLFKEDMIRSVTEKIKHKSLDSKTTKLSKIDVMV